MDVIGTLKVGGGNVNDVFYHVPLNTLRCVGYSPQVGETLHSEDELLKQLIF